MRLNFKEGELVVRTILSGKTITIKKPVKPMNGDETNLEIWRAKIKNFEWLAFRVGMTLVPRDVVMILVFLVFMIAPRVAPILSKVSNDISTSSYDTKKLTSLTYAIIMARPPMLSLEKA